MSVRDRGAHPGARSIAESIRHRQGKAMSWDDYFAADAGSAEAERRGKKRTVTVGWTVRFAKSDAI